MTDADPKPDDVFQPTAAFDNQADVSGAMVAGRYKLLQKIGEGGMGAVYLARQSEPVRRDVALKIILPGMDSRQVLARFEAERQTLALLDHPNIARVLDAGTTDRGQPFFVMELIRGVPITQFCNERRLPLRARIDLFVQVCLAIQHAHQKGIIHRDIKPSNVMVALYDDKPVPKVIDFGVAKATTQPLTERTMFTQYGALVGTLEYMSPEQAQLNHLDIDTRSDVYSLGVLLYELLTGGTPFEKKRLRSAAFDEMLRIIREEEPPTPSKRLSTTEELPSIAAQRSLEPRRLGALLRGDLDWIVMKCLEKDRGRRYDTANGLATDLQRFLADEPVSAGPPRPGYRLRKFLRRHRGPVLAGLLLLGAIVAGAVISISLAVRAMDAERLAKANEQNAVKEREAAIKAGEGERKAREEAERLAAKAAIQSDLARLTKDNTAIGLLNLAATLETTPAHLTEYRECAVANILRAGQEICPLPPLTHDGFTPKGAALNKAGTTALTWGVDDTVRMWEALTGREKSVLKHPGPVETANFTEDGRSIVTYENVDRKVRVWDAETGVCRFTSAPHAGPIRMIEFSASGDRIATLSDNAPTYEALPLPTERQAVLRCFDAAAGRLLGEVEGLPPNNELFAIDSQGRYLVMKDAKRSLLVYSLIPRLPSKTVAGADGTVSNGSISPNGSRFGLTLYVAGRWMFSCWETSHWTKVLDQVDAGQQGSCTWADDSTMTIGNKTYCFETGKAKPIPQDFYAASRKGDLLFSDGDVFDLKSGVLAPARGTRYHSSARQFAKDGRWLNQRPIVDLATEIDVGREDDSEGVSAQESVGSAPNLVFVQLLERYRRPASAVDRTALRLIPTAPIDDVDSLTLYCRLVAGGTLAADGKILLDSAAQWDQLRGRLRERLEVRRQRMAPAVYRILAAVCQDPEYWLRQQLALRSLRSESLRHGDERESTQESFWDELLRREPTWANYHDRAMALVPAGQTISPAQLELLLSAWRVGGARYRDLTLDTLIQAVSNVSLSTPIDGKDHGRAMEALGRLLAEIGGDRRFSVLRLASLNALRAKHLTEAEAYAAEYERGVFRDWRGAYLDAVRGRNPNSREWDNFLTMKSRACISHCLQAMIHHLRGEKGKAESAFGQADELRRELRSKVDRDLVFQETFDWTERFLRDEKL